MIGGFITRVSPAINVHLHCLLPVELGSGCEPYDSVAGLGAGRSAGHAHGKDML